MTTFNLGTMEIVVIVVIAILAVGPARVVQLIRSIQRLAAQARGLTGQLMSTLQAEMGGADDLNSIKSTIEEAAQAVQGLKRGVTGTVAGADGGIDALKETVRETRKALTGVKEDLTQVSKHIQADPQTKSGDSTDKQAESGNSTDEQPKTEQPDTEQSL